MKKTQTKFITLSVLLAIFLAACGPASSPPAQDEAPAAGPAAATALPTEEPASDGLVSQASGACSNAFYPLRSDTVWTYQIVDPAQEKNQGSFNLSYQDISADSFVALMSLKDAQTDEIFQAESTWYCSNDGLLSSDFATLNFVSSIDVNIQTLDYAGITLLPEDQWEVGKTWDTSYQVNVTFSVEGMDIASAMDIQISNTISAIESVSVAAGTFPEAYRVDTSGSMTMDMEGDMAFSMGDLPITYTTWFVKDLGMVKQISTGPDADGTFTELVSVE